MCDALRLYASAKRMHHAAFYACMLARDTCIVLPMGVRYQRPDTRGCRVSGSVSGLTHVGVGCQAADTHGCRVSGA